MQMSLGTLKICSRIGVLQNLAERKKQMLVIPAKRKDEFLDKFVKDGAFVRWKWDQLRSITRNWLISDATETQTC